MEAPNDKLPRIPKKDIFTTPDGYFDSLPDRIGKRITTPEATVVPMRTAWWYAGLAAAASILILAAFLSGVFTADQITGPDQLLSEVAVEDCMSYLETLDVDTQEIILSSDSIAVDDLIDGEAEINFGDESLELLFEKYGATEDEKMQTL